MDNLYIVIPAYNEQENVRNIIEQWYPVVEKTGEKSRLLIVNDGSKDATYEIMQECAQSRSQFIPLTKKNGGHGAAVLYGYEYAIKEDADFIFQTDSDGQTLPEEFWQFWDKRNRYAMLIGHRNKREDGISRILVTKVLKVVIKFCFKVSVTDANTPFRLMKTSVLAEQIKFIPKDFNLSNVLISVIYAKKKLPVKYIPITFKQRQGGVNSINMKKITLIGIQAVQDFRMINKMLESM